MRATISILLLIIILQRCLSKNSAPVIIIDRDSVMKHVQIEPNPFTSMSSNDLTKYAMDAANRTKCIIIFVEDILSTEDISIKGNNGTPFYDLQKGIKDNQVLYIPSVQEPYNTLKQIFVPQMSNVYLMDTGEIITNLNQNNFIYVFFKNDGGLNRLETLKKHDVIMRDIYFVVNQLRAGPVLAFYTGLWNPVGQMDLVPKVNEEEEKDQDKSMIVTPDALFKFSGIYLMAHSLRSGTEEISEIAVQETPVVEQQMRSHDGLSTTMLMADRHVQFNFEFDDQTWRLANVALLESGHEVGRTRTSISAPWQHSYHCAEPISVVNLRDGSSITISEYQIEPVFRRVTIKVFCVFNKAINCGPYFNTKILAGLLVVFIFVAITSWGVIMIYNCGANTRYDDPNEKTLVVAQGFYINEDFINE